MEQQSECNQQNFRFFLAFLNHLIWSTQTVASRYLQVYATPKVFDGQGVLATSKATSAILIYISSHLNICSESEEKDHLATSSSDKRASEPSTINRPSIKTKIMFGLSLGTVATCRAALNIASAKFTLSYYVTTINSLSPLVVSIGDALLLKTELPRAIWPCSVASFLGCTLIGFSQSPFFANGDNDSNSDYRFSSQDAIGCGLQFASMCFSSAARLLMKSTQGILTRNEALQVNNICNTIFPILYTLIANPKGWLAFRYMNGPSFLAWITISVLVYTIASTGQMSLVRSMGPGMYSSLSAIRVLASALISAFCLNEPVQNWLEWLGLFMTMMTMTIYTLISMDWGKTKNAAGVGGGYSKVNQVEITNEDDHEETEICLQELSNGNEMEMTINAPDPLKVQSTTPDRY